MLKYIKNPNEIFYQRFHNYTNKYDEIKWFHRIEFPDGEVTPGGTPTHVQFEKMKCILPHFKNKTVLDVGAWDGFWSFKAESLGASRVLATDYLVWSGPGWGNKKGFEYAKKKLNSKVESLEIDTPFISPETVGKFDIVLMLGLIYHLPNFLTTIVNIAQCAKECLVIETLEDWNIDQEIPLVKIYSQNIEYCGEAKKDMLNHTKGFEKIPIIPNIEAVKTMMRFAGFKNIKEKHFHVNEDQNNMRGAYCGYR